MIRTIVFFISMMMMVVQSYLSPFASSPMLPTPTSSPVASASPSPVPIPTPPPTTDLTANADTATRVRDTVVPHADTIDLTRRLRLNGQDIPATSALTITDRAVGSKDVFWMSDALGHRYYTVTASLAAKSDHAYMYVAAGYKASGADLQAALQTFEDKIYPTNHRYFGSEWTPGVDHDPHITILNADISGAAGYFSPADEFPTAVNRYSNMREIIYISIPPSNELYPATIAHEFQHMIEFHENPNQSVWLNEGASELAMWLNGYSVGGTDSSFTFNPDTQLNSWGSDPNLSISHYGAAYLFLRYLDHLYGAGFIRNIVASRQTGPASVNYALRQQGVGGDFDSLFKDWVVTNWLGKRVNNDPRYSYGDASPPSVQRKVTISSYPTTHTDTVHQYAADYYELSGDGHDLTINFSGDSSVKVIGNQPHSGRYEWWSNRDDAADSTLTRDFDLSAVSGAVTFSFAAWYDLERGFDYAYVEASSDGGNTWQALPATDTSDYNPNGNSYGPAYTGVSGGGSDPTAAMWVNEQVDLSAYAGQQIKLRFEQITDGAYNAQGLALDDFSIPQLGYHDDTEGGDGGWQAAGFLRLDNTMPQRYFVQAVEMMADNSYKVVDLPVDASGKGSLTIPALGGTVQSAALIVATYAPKTTQAAHYTLDMVSRR